MAPKEEFLPKGTIMKSYRDHREHPCVVMMVKTVGWNDDCDDLPVVFLSGRKAGRMERVDNLNVGWSIVYKPKARKR